MAGTSSNKPEEIELILDLRRRGVKTHEIVKICNAIWKHRARKESSVAYVVTNWSKHADYKERQIPTTPSATLSQAITNAINDPLVARRAKELYNIVANSPPMGQSGDQQFYAQPSQPAHQQRLSRAQLPARPPYVGSPTLTPRDQRKLGSNEQDNAFSGPSTNYADDEALFNSGTGSQGSLSYQTSRTGRATVNQPNPYTTKRSGNSSVTQTDSYADEITDGFMPQADRRSISKTPRKAPRKTPRKTPRKAPANVSQQSSPYTHDETRECASFEDSSEFAEQVRGRLNSAEQASLHHNPSQQSRGASQVSQTASPEYFSPYSHIQAPISPYFDQQQQILAEQHRTPERNRATPSYSTEPNIFSNPDLAREYYNQPPNIQQQFWAPDQITSSYHSSLPVNNFYGQDVDQSFNFPTPLLNINQPFHPDSLNTLVPQSPSQTPQQAYIFNADDNLPPSPIFSRRFAPASNYVPKRTVLSLPEPQFNSLPFTGPKARGRPAMPKTYEILSDVIDRALEPLPDVRKRKFSPSHRAEAQVPVAKIPEEVAAERQQAASDACDDVEMQMARERQLQDLLYDGFELTPQWNEFSDVPGFPGRDDAGQLMSLEDLSDCWDEFEKGNA